MEPEQENIERDIHKNINISFSKTLLKVYFISLSLFPFIALKDNKTITFLKISKSLYIPNFNMLINNLPTIAQNQW